MTKHIFFSILFLLFGFCCAGQAQAQIPRCQFDLHFFPSAKGDATNVNYGQGHFDVTSSAGNTLRGFKFRALIEFYMLDGFKSGDHCFASPLAKGDSFKVDNLEFQTEVESFFALPSPDCGFNIGRPSGFKSGAINTSGPNANVYEVSKFACRGELSLTISVSVIDPSVPFNAYRVDPFASLIKATTGHAGGIWTQTVSTNIVSPLTFNTPVKKTSCIVTLSSKVR